MKRGGYTNTAGLKLPDRKRKAAVMDQEGRSTYDHYAPNGQRQRQPKHPRHMDLSAMLYPDRISPENYHRIKEVLTDQRTTISTQQRKISDHEETIADQEAFIEYQRQGIAKGKRALETCNRLSLDRYSQVCNLRKDVEQLERTQDSANAFGPESLKPKPDQRKHVGDAENHKRLRARKYELEAELEENKQWMAVGTKALHENTAKVKKFEAENARLNQILIEKEDANSKLNEQLLEITNAPPYEATSTALEVQASRTLGLVNGLKADVAREQAKVKSMEAQVERSNGTARSQAQAKVELQRQVEDLKRSLSKQESNTAVATRQAKEAQSLAEEQDALITRLMEENARLSGA